MPATVVGLLARLLLVVGFAAAMHWEHSAQLTDDFRLLWNINDDRIQFEMQVRTHGYIGLGLARPTDSRSTTGGDLVVGWVSEGQAYFQDRHFKSKDAHEPLVDNSQDYSLLLGYENHTHTVMRFSRRLDTCDPAQDVTITNDTMRLIVVYHDQDPPANGFRLPGSLSEPQIGIRAIVPMLLAGRVGSAGASPLAASEQHGHVLELRNELVTLPRFGETLEWCRMFELANYTRKHHMIRFEPVFGSVEGRRQLDAVLLYECHGTSARLVQLARTTGSPCPDMRQTKGLVCDAVVVSWTRGSAGLRFPPEAGYPIDAHKERFYMMESHYSSPVPATGTDDGFRADGVDLAAAFRNGGAPVADGSGLRLHMTAVLRRHDAGVLSIGMSPDWRHIIPPGQKRVISEGHCVDECTRRTLPADGMHVFALVMQTHRIGRTVRLRHVRQHEELLPIADDANVQENYAEYRRIEPPTHVRRGDNLIVECTYDSSDRDAITLGSMSARGESCQVLAVYYPRQTRMSRCQSLPSLPTVLHSLGIDELASGSQPVLIAAPVALAGQTLESRLLGYDWATQFGSFERVTRTGSFVAVCTSARRKSALVAGAPDTFHRPRTTKAWSIVPKDRWCATDALDNDGGGLRMDVPNELSENDRLLVGNLNLGVESMSLSGATRRRAGGETLAVLFVVAVAAMRFV